MANGYLIPALTGIVGLVMLFAAESIVNVLVIVLGIFLILSGIYSVFTTSKLVDEKAFKINLFSRGVLSVILGLLCIILPNTMVQFSWKVMMIILGIFALGSAASEIYAVIMIKEAGLEIKHYVIEIVGTLIGAIVLFMIPASFGFTLIKIAGAVFILFAIYMAIASYRNRDIIEEDAEVTDDDSGVEEK